MIKRIFYLMIMVFILNTHYVFSKESNHQPEPVIIGVYVTDIFGGDIAKRMVSINFWVWLIYKDKALNPLKYLDIVNAEDVKRLNETIERLPDGRYLASAKLHVSLHQNWNFVDFPVDDQMIEIMFEDSRFNNSELVYITEANESGIDSNIDISGWDITNNYWNKGVHQYYTNFGNENIKGQTSYSRATFHIELERDSLRKLIQVFGVIYLACFLAFCIYFLPLDELRGRLGLTTGAIFALVGNKLLTDNYLPSSSEMTLVDQVQLISMIFLGFSIIISLIIFYLHKKEHRKFAYALNFISMIISVTIIPFMQIYLPLNHMHI